MVASGLAVCLEVADTPGGSHHRFGLIESVDIPSGRYRLVLDGGGVLDILVETAEEEDEFLGDGYCVVRREASFIGCGPLQ